MDTIKQLVSQLWSLSYTADIEDEGFELPPADLEQQIARFPAVTGFLLPRDMQEFYRRCGGAWPLQAEYTFCSLRGVEQSRRGMRETLELNEQEVEWSPSWFVFCLVDDGSCFCITLSPDDDSPEKDVFLWPIWEMRPSTIVARSFTEFLTDLVNHQFAMNKYGTKNYGTVTYDGLASIP